MSVKKSVYSSPEALRQMIEAARGKSAVDLVLVGVQYLDVFSGVWRQGDVAIHKGVIVGLGEEYDAVQRIEAQGKWLVPGFIDAHVHVESSLMTPVCFQQAVLPEGTTSVIWDPHEIANVWGAAGIRWALEASAGTELDFFVMVPSCVPSTSPELNLETSGAVLKAADLAPFRTHERVLGLAEMMNFPGLLGGDPDVLAKLTDFAQMRRDGHCPTLSGKDLNAYGVAGIHSCHESTTLPEAEEKLRKGVHVLIREGSCAKDADALLPILNPYSSACVGLCSDDRNPADIAAEGHINAIINKALKLGQEPINVLRAASFAAARLYGLEDRGAVAPGYIADLVLLEPKQAGNWGQGMRVLEVFKRGKQVRASALENAAASRTPVARARNLHLDAVTESTFRVPAQGRGASCTVRVIDVIPRQILTHAFSAKLATREGAHGREVVADPKQDVLKMAVLERHHGSNRGSVAFVRGFKLHGGAIATSINHDSHNVICVGSSEALMAAAVNELRRLDGGIVVVSAEGKTAGLALEVGGLMTDRAPSAVAAALEELKALAKSCGCVLEEPFLQLSFLALPVIPALKLTDRGLVDVGAFALVPVVEAVSEDVNV